MHTVQKILIIRFSSLGDIVLATPLIRQLRTKFPKAQLDFVLRSEYRELLEFHPHLSHLYTFDIETGFTGLRQLKRQLKNNRYDVILDIHNNLRSRYICLGQVLAGSRVLRVRKQQFIRFLLVKCKINLYHRIYGRIIPVWEKYLRTAQPLGIDMPGGGEKNTLEGGGLEIFISDQDGTSAENLRKEKWGDDPYIAIAPGARHFTKRWPEEYYAALMHRINQEKNVKFILVGGKEDQSLCDNIVKRVGVERSYSLAGKLSIPETAAIIKGARLLITNDSGLMHVGDALKKPLIAIFGSTVRELGFFPSHPTSRVLENKELSCRPCSHIGRDRCPKKHFDCMKALTPDQVWDQAEKLL